MYVSFETCEVQKWDFYRKICQSDLLNAELQWVNWKFTGKMLSIFHTYSAKLSAQIILNPVFHPFFQKVSSNKSQKFRIAWERTEKGRYTTLQQHKNDYRRRYLKNTRRSEGWEQPVHCNRPKSSTTLESHCTSHAFPVEELQETSCCASPPWCCRYGCAWDIQTDVTRETATLPVCDDVYVALQAGETNNLARIFQQHFKGCILQLQQSFNYVLLIGPCSEQQTKRISV